MKNFIILLFIFQGCATPQYHCVNEGYWKNTTEYVRGYGDVIVDKYWQNNGMDCYPMKGD